MSEQHTFNRQNRVFPQKSGDKPLDIVEEQRIPERRWLGHILSILGAILGIAIVIFCIYMIQDDGVNDTADMILVSLAIIAGFSLSFFHIAALSKPEYLGGQASFLKILPLLFGISFLLMIVFIFIMAFLGWDKDIISTPFLAVIAVVYLIISALVYYVYSQDDDSGSCWLCLKPWNLKIATKTNFEESNFAV